MLAATAVGFTPFLTTNTSRKRQLQSWASFIDRAHRVRCVPAALLSTNRRSFRALYDKHAPFGQQQQQQATAATAAATHFEGW